MIYWNAFSLAMKASNPRRKESFMSETEGGKVAKWEEKRNLVQSDDGTLCAITPGPNLVPATPEEERRFRGGSEGGGNFTSVEREIPV